MARLILVAIFVILNIMLVFAGNACAGIVVNGYLDDWGVAPGAFGASDWSPHSGVIYTVEDQNTSYLNPGYGGQEFDAEAIYSYRETGYIYLAIVTGHPSAGAAGEKPGDIFIDFGAGMQYGLETTGANAGKLYKNPLWNSSPNWGGAGGRTTMKDGPWEYMGLTEFVYLNTYIGAGDSNDHWVMEMSIPESYFGSDWKNDGTVHWTETCGNDAIDLQVPAPANPEPATLWLLGTGLAGLLKLRGRKK